MSLRSVYIAVTPINIISPRGNMDDVYNSTRMSGRYLRDPDIDFVYSELTQLSACFPYSQLVSIVSISLRDVSAFVFRAPSDLSLSGTQICIR